MKKLLFKLQNGDKITQRNAFILLALLISIAVAVLNHDGIIDLSALKDR